MIGGLSNTKEVLAKPIINSKNISEKVDKGDVYGAYGKYVGVNSNYKNNLEIAELKQSKHFFIFFTNKKDLNSKSNLKDMKDGYIANVTTKNKFLKSTYHKGYNSDKVYECPNNSKTILTVFEDINNFNAKKIELTDIEKVSETLSKNNSNLKTIILKELGKDVNDIKKTIKSEGFYLDLLD